MAGPAIGTTRSRSRVGGRNTTFWLSGLMAICGWTPTSSASLTRADAGPAIGTLKSLVPPAMDCVYSTRWPSGEIARKSANSPVGLSGTGGASPWIGALKSSSGPLIVLCVNTTRSPFGATWG